MSDAVYLFDVDDCLEIGGQIRRPSSSGPVTIASIRAEAAPPDGDICGVVGNWVNLPSLLPDWREIFQFLLPPMPSSSSKGFWLAWTRAQYPGYQHYVLVGNDPNNPPAYWSRDWPGSLPVTTIGGDSLLSNDIGAASEAGFEFIKEDAWARGQRTGPIPPPNPARPFYQFPKYTRPPMIYKTFSAPEILKADDAKGIVEAIVSVTGNKDLQGDIIDPGAWKTALDSGPMPRITADHAWNVRSNLGRTLAAEEWMPGDPRLPDTLKEKGYGGLWVTGQFNMDKQLARETYSDLKGGFVNEFSVGFDVASDEKGRKCEEAGDDGYHIKAIAPWYEWSVVFMGANPETRPISLKAAAVDAVVAEQVAAPEMTAAAFLQLSDEEILAIYAETADLPVDKLTLKAQWSRAFVRFADAIPTLRKHARAEEMVTNDDAPSEPTIAPSHVPEQMLKKIGAAVGNSVAAAIAARRNPTM